MSFVLLGINGTTAAQTMSKGHSSNWKSWYPRLLVVKERADLLQLVKLFNFKILAKRGKFETTYSDAADANTKIRWKLVELSRHYSQLGYLWIWQTDGGLMSHSSTPGLICLLHLSPFHCHPDCYQGRRIWSSKIPESSQLEEIRPHPFCRRRSQFPSYMTNGEMVAVTEQDNNSVFFTWFVCINPQLCKKKKPNR